MKKIKDYLNNNSIVFLIIGFAFIVCMSFSIQNTYAAGGFYTISFYNAYGDTKLKTCYTTSNGKIEAMCAAPLKTICQVWNTNKCTQAYGCSNQGDDTAISVGNRVNPTNYILDVVFTSDTAYYCQGGTSAGSTSYDVACYVCDSNSNIKKWATNGDADSYCSSYSVSSVNEDTCSTGCYVCDSNSNIKKWKSTPAGDSSCPNGYTKDTSINQSNCIIITTTTKAPTTTTTKAPTTTTTKAPTTTTVAPACYVCKTNEDVKKWGTSASGDKNCSTGYNKVPGISLANCVSNACYVCKADSNIKVWKNNGTGDSACTGGYEKDEGINKPQCVSNACYVCKTDSNIMKWSYNGDADQFCSSGYNIDNNKPENECVTIPKACRVCKNDNTIMKWDTNNDPDDACNDGYVVDTGKDEEQCVTIPKVCHVCKSDDNIKKWGISNDADEACQDGYTDIDIPEVDCITNPATGNTALLIIAFGTFVILSGIYVYYKKYMKRNEYLKSFE